MVPAVTSTLTRRSIHSSPSRLEVRVPVLAGVVTAVVDSRQLERPGGELLDAHVAGAEVDRGNDAARCSAETLPAVSVQIQRADDLGIVICDQVQHELAAALERVDVVEAEEGVGLVRPLRQGARVSRSKTSRRVPSSGQR